MAKPEAVMKHDRLALAGIDDGLESGFGRLENRDKKTDKSVEQVHSGLLGYEYHQHLLCLK